MVFMQTCITVSLLKNKYKKDQCDIRDGDYIDLFLGKNLLQIGLKKDK